jgi:hypothetical protein
MNNLASSLSLFVQRAMEVRAAMAGKAPQGLGIAWFLLNRKQRRQLTQHWHWLPLMSLPLWGPCLPKIGHGGPGSSNKSQITLRECTGNMQDNISLFILDKR